MMNNALRRMLFACVLCGLAAVGCYDTVYFDGEEAKVLVLNAVLVEGRDSVEVMLTETKAAYDTSAWRTFPAAEVRLYEDGKEVGQGEWRPDGRFVVSVRVKEKCTYRVEAVVPGKGMVWGETTVPERLEECRIEIWQNRTTYAQGKMEVNVRWKDKAGEDNVYWITQKQTGTVYHEFTEDTVISFPDSSKWRSVQLVETESPLVDPFNKQVFIGDGATEVSYFEYLRVEDGLRDGEVLDLSFNYIADEWKIVVMLMSVDMHLDGYLKSMYENYDNSVPHGDGIPWVFHSAYMHSNVQGGTGLVASYSQEAAVLRVPPDEAGRFGPGVPVRK